MHESCGVIGVYYPGEDVARLTYFALFPLQRCGQESAGIATGHNRYSTRDSSQVLNIQPFIVGQGNNAIAHNGNIINTEHLYEELVKTVTSTAFYSILYDRLCVSSWMRSMALHRELKWEIPGRALQEKGHHLASFAETRSVTL